MRQTVSLAIAGLILGAGAALAQGAPDAPRIYAYPGENFCPAGLRPVTIDGVICCGTPNQTVSYAAMKATPARKTVVRRRAASSDGYIWHGGKGVAPDE
ncbi:hypothetical protein [Vannielia litorea]|uniref:Uncharacterized protein n=1 Tax=Vannielia litorea TaxID=1217970 RepID=A0A1N6EE15_9RHOB|nr:hypothetical protein [Vannielia litorea]SIN81254.1 hypothetical protein SAMN05444002_0654 [Vannielia litorea]